MAHTQENKKNTIADDMRITRSQASKLDNIQIDVNDQEKESIDASEFYDLMRSEVLEMRESIKQISETAKSCD